MKHQTLKIVLSVICIGAVCLLAVYILNQPAFLKSLNLSNSGNIGSAIGGITAPIIGIGTIIFLYLTLNRQIDNNQQQQIKNESDVIFLLLNQLDTEYNNFYLNIERKGEKYRITGFEALVEYCDSFSKFANPLYSFKTYYTTSQILLILRSYKLIEKRISYSNISSEIKGLFKEKLGLYYDIKLRDQLTKLATVFNTSEKLTDEATKEIEEFIKEHS